MTSKNTVIVLKLIGTLIEAEHVKKHNYREDEYYSRILYGSRKINSLLKCGIKIVILGASDHFGIESVVRISKDISSLIDENYKNNIEYVFTKNNQEITTSINIKDNELAVVKRTKKDIYEYIGQKYYNYRFILIDDMQFQSDEFVYVYKNHGEIHYIYNFFSSRPLGEHGYEKYTNLFPRYPYCDNQALINKYLSLAEINSAKETQDFYKKYLSRGIDLAKLIPLVLLEKDFITNGISKEEFKQAYDKGVINVYPSFEKAYEKVLSRFKKITKAYENPKKL